MQPQLEEVHPTARRIGAGSSSDELQEVQITPRYVGPGMEAANARLDNNPVNSIYQSAAVMTPAEARAMEEIVVEDRRIYGGEDVGLDLYNYLWHTTPGTYQERQQRLAALENSTTNRYLVRQESIAGRRLVPTSTWNQAIADEFHRVGGPKEFGAFGSLEREALRDYGGGTGPNAVSGTLMNWMGAVDDWALSQHDKGAAMYARGDYLGAAQAAFGTFGTDFAAHLAKGALGLGVLATDTDAQLSLMRRVDWAMENPGRALNAASDAFLALSTRDKQFAVIDAYAGLRSLGVDVLPNSLDNSLTRTLAQYDAQSPLIPVTAGEMGVFGVRGLQSPLIKRNPDLTDDTFVRFDPIEFDSSINDLGIQTRFFDQGKIWLTKYGDIKHITNPRDLETVLYRKDLWTAMEGRFQQGATLRAIDVTGPTPAGVTNRTDGVRQWYIEHNVSPNEFRLIQQLKTPQ